MGHNSFEYPTHFLRYTQRTATKNAANTLFANCLVVCVDSKLMKLSNAMKQKNADAMSVLFETRGSDAKRKQRCQQMAHAKRKKRSVPINRKSCHCRSSQPCQRSCVSHSDLHDQSSPAGRSFSFLYARSSTRAVEKNCVSHRAYERWKTHAVPCQRSCFCHGDLHDQSSPAARRFSFAGSTLSAAQRKAAAASSPRG